MFQIGTNWQLWDLSKQFDKDVSGISLRGYKHDEPILLPAEFSGSRPLSVDDIASIYCPTRRDLFLSKKRRIQGSPTWGRIAGPLIEEFCTGLIDEYHNLFDDSSQESYDSIKNLMEDYSGRFITRKQNALNKLKRYAKFPAEDITKFVFVLQYTGRYELAMLGADWFLNGGTSPKKALLARVPIKHDVKISPNTKVIGISSPSTPDFLINSLQVVGDIKSGDAFKDFYTLTCAGYALAYENQYGPGNDMNFGIIYFLETRSRAVTTARSYAFVIDDQIRHEFLDRRNEAFGILQQETPPPVADRNKYCIYCKYLGECDKDR